MRDVKDKIWTQVYEWALRYARVCRNNLAAVEDLAHEMALVVMQAKWRNMEYAKQAMRNKLVDIIRHEKMMRTHHPYLEDIDPESVYINEENGFEDRDLIRFIFEKSDQRSRHILRHLYEGRDVQEIIKIEKLSKRTIYRSIQSYRSILVGNSR